MSSSFVYCPYCEKSFLKDNRRINEAKKIGYKLYCSLICQSSAKNRNREVICENSNCRKKFKRSINSISFRNFCSQSCYGTFVSLRNKSTIKSFKYCQYCGTRIMGEFRYCSPKCWGLDHQISKKEIIKQIQQLAKKLGRTPTRRECSFSTSSYRSFGSWTNAVIAAGLSPHRSLNQRMYKRQRCIAKDGHVCNSVSELIIDNWLYKNNVPHQKETPYPSGKFVADWSLSENTLVEYFGLAKDSQRYDREIEKKQQICKDMGLELIEIYSKDLFPDNKLADIFKV